LELLNRPDWIDGGGYRGEGFVTYVPPAHGGPCALGYSSRHGRHWAVFPSYKDTENAAAGACRWDIGGYDNVSVHPLNAVALDTQRYETALEWLFGDIEPLDEENRPRGVTYIARVAMRDIVRKIAENPDELLGMEWLDLERALFEALHGLGYSVRRTRSTKDGGYDLDVEIEDRRFLVEVKHWSAPDRVGPEAIKRFAEVVLREQAFGGLFLSSSGYTSTVAAARLEVSRVPIMLGDSRKMLSFCRSFVLSEGGVWERDGSLTEVFFKDAL
jgi:hypothetical protein